MLRYVGLLADSDCADYVIVIVQFLQSHKHPHESLPLPQKSYSNTLQVVWC